MIERMKSSLLLLLFPLLAHSAWDKIDPKDYPLAPPPAAGSAAYKKDFEILHDYQKGRSKEECALSVRQRFPNFDVLFGNDWDVLTKEEKARARPVALAMMRMAEKVSLHHKDAYGRPRPYVTDPTLEPCAIRPGGSKAYPSSHAADGAAAACVLALYYPDKAKEILAYGDYIGELRVIAGVHHPSDVKAGQDLGKEVCRRAQEEPDFPVRRN